MTLFQMTESTDSGSASAKKEKEKKNRKKDKENGSGSGEAGTQDSFNAPEAVVCMLLQTEAGMFYMKPAGKRRLLLQHLSPKRKPFQMMLLENDWVSCWERRLDHLTSYGLWILAWDFRHRLYSALTGNKSDLLPTGLLEQLCKLPRTQKTVSRRHYIHFTCM